MPTETEQSNLAAVESFFEALQNGVEPAALAEFYSDDVVQEEFPNAFLPQGARRGLTELQEAAARGNAAMAQQSFEILNAVARGDTVVVESNWTGTLAVDLSEQTPAGSQMRARFAQIFEFADGKIIAQRNYDCFYPF
ncbi:nuclear transport factor 2 family protein [Gaopeijia maritima]|uniref:Nuclear transport factor 2 family protein n=1 Tax=Gaopeijia maritima TaxID=3119007 RepID=A0ABU9E6C8_9BACT